MIDISMSCPALVTSIVTVGSTNVEVLVPKNNIPNEGWHLKYTVCKLFQKSEISNRKWMAHFGTTPTEIGHYPTSFPLSSFHSLFPPSPITLSAS